MFSARYLSSIARQTQSVWLNQSQRQFQTTILRLSANVLHVKSDADFQKQVLDSKKLFVVDFHATWCGPCKVLEPRLEKVLNNYNKKIQSTSNEKQIQLAKVDIDEFGELSAKFGVEAVPTVVAIKNGKEISRFTGAADESRIEKMLEHLGR